MPGIPKTSREIDLFGTWGETHFVEPWVISDFCEEDTRLIIFANKTKFVIQYIRCIPSFVIPIIHHSSTLNR